MRTKTQVLIAFFAVTLFLFFQLSPVVAGQVVKILAIGNSFSTDAAESHVDDLAKADGIELIIANMYIGGCSLERHWNNAEKDLPAYSYRKITNGDTVVVANQNLITAIQDENWDYITFQQASPLSGKVESYFPFLPDLMAYTKRYATNPRVQFAFHQTWAYAANTKNPSFDNYNKDQLFMYESIVEAVKEVVKKTGIKIVIPSGTAIQNGRTSFVGDKFTRDGFHLSLGLGRFTAACVWYETLLHRPVRKNSFVPAGVSPEQAAMAKEAAHNAVKRPYKLTPFKK
jgi:hypothetical protein